MFSEIINFKSSGRVQVGQGSKVNVVVVVKVTFKFQWRKNLNGQFSNDVIKMKYNIRFGIG